MARQTRGGVTLTTYMWGMLEASYRAAGLDPGSYMIVTQGSFRGDDAAAASGSTHDKAGAADLRTWNLPDKTREDLCRVLVVALRERNGCAWYRNEQHGGMDPHIHVILRDDVEALSSGARSQVTDYDQGQNGLSNQGPDYHPRPRQAPWQTYGDVTEDDDVFIFETHYDKAPDGDASKTGAHYLIVGKDAVQLAAGYTATDVPRVRSASEDGDAAFWAAGFVKHKL